MDKTKFDAVFPIICSSLAEKIASELNLSEEDAVNRAFCKSYHSILTSSSYFGKVRLMHSLFLHYFVRVTSRLYLSVSTSCPAATSFTIYEMA